jgi:hypothetical protein
MSLSALVRWLGENPSSQATAQGIPWREVSMPALQTQGQWAAELAFKDGSTLRLSAQAANALLEPWLASRPCLR